MQNYFLSSHLNWLIESVSSFLFSISSVEMKWYRSQAAHTLAPFLLSPEVSDSCRFFGPSLPPGCLTVLCCHGNRGSEASSCDWYAAEVFPNLTPWLPLPILLPPVCCCLPPPPSSFPVWCSFRQFELMSAADVFVSVSICTGVPQCPALLAHCACWHFSKLRMWHEVRAVRRKLR